MLFASYLASLAKENHVMKPSAREGSATKLQNREKGTDTGRPSTGAISATSPPQEFNVVSKFCGRNEESAVRVRSYSSFKAPFKHHLFCEILPIAPLGLTAFQIYFHYLHGRALYLSVSVSPWGHRPHYSAVSKSGFKCQPHTLLACLYLQKEHKINANCMGCCDKT